MLISIAVINHIEVKICASVICRPLQLSSVMGSKAFTGITASTSAQNASQSSGQRRNFMQPDVVQSAAIVKASGDFDLPLPPAIANGLYDIFAFLF